MINCILEGNLLHAVGLFKEPAYEVKCNYYSEDIIIIIIIIFIIIISLQRDLLHGQV